MTLILLLKILSKLSDDNDWEKVIEMDQTYYTVKVIQNGIEYYNLLEDQLMNDARTVNPQHLLNNSRGAAFVNFSFPFPFYGHNISK